MKKPRKARNTRKKAAATKVGREEQFYVAGLVVIGTLIGVLWIFLARL